MLRFLTLPAASAAALLAAAAPAGDHQWKTIGNATFGFSACYPADLFHPDGDGLNVGGQRYAGAGGAQLVISGLANQYGDSLSVTAQQTFPNTYALKRTVTYKAIRPDWVVVSGRMADGKLFYERVIRKQKDYAFFFMSYPAAQSSVFDGVVGRLGQCLR